MGVIIDVDDKIVPVHDLFGGKINSQAIQVESGMAGHSNQAGRRLPHKGYSILPNPPQYCGLNSENRRYIQSRGGEGRGER